MLKTGINEQRHIIVCRRYMRPQTEHGAIKGCNERFVFLSCFTFPYTPFAMNRKSTLIYVRRCGRSPWSECPANDGVSSVPPQCPVFLLALDDA